MLWQKIRNRQLGYKFKFQYPVGSYIADFACVELKLIVEVDGGQHCESKTDEGRTRFLEAAGYKVVRFWNNDVIENTDGVASSLLQTLSCIEREKEQQGSPAPSPTPVGEGRGEGLAIDGGSDAENAAKPLTLTLSRKREREHDCSDGKIDHDPR